MTINLGTPKPTELKPRITVIGVGGAGGNAVNNMISANLEGVEFVACNTDAQALGFSKATRKVQLGVNLTQGLGSGSKPEVGRAAAAEAKDEILDHLAGSHMAFVTAGMGGGTGTGAAPVIAQLARDAGILTVGVITKPFEFEGQHRMNIAEAGIAELQNYVDTLLIIPNQNLFRVANERTTFADAFKMADDVLHAGVRGVTDLMVMPGLINLDFADVKAVMEEMGKAMMGTGEAEGDKRALDAAEAAISNPLLEDTSMRGARGVLINITGGPDMTLFEVDEAVKRIKDEVAENANIIFGSTFDDRMEGRMRISIVATGIDVAVDARERKPQLQVVSAVGGSRGPYADLTPRDLAPEPATVAPTRMPAAVRSFDSLDRMQPRAYDSGAATASSLARQPEPEVRRQPESVAMAARIMAELEATRIPDPAELRQQVAPRAEARQPEAPRLTPTAARPAQATSAPMLRSVTSAQPVSDHYIPPAAVEAKPSATARRSPDPFAEAAVTNGAGSRRTEQRSLLERMTGLARNRTAPAPAEQPAREAPRAVQTAPRMLPPRVNAPVTAPAAAAPTPAAPPPAAQAPAPVVAEPASAAAPKIEAALQLKVDPPARPASAQREDDLLEIPAFLRRQTNG
ncbi:MAG: cell division protein FtsZ [Alphaproteobacteria bacterium]|nr:cell division protein FtsZ [Alphaproteobacteria bacterium]